jgi:hypothetical protein
MLRKEHQGAPVQNPLYRLFTTAALALCLGCTLAGCGDEEDPRLSTEDVVCLKIIRNGGTCGSASSGTGTATETITATTTTTDTSTVTVTSTSSG